MVTRKPRVGSVADVVSMLVAEGFTDEATVTYAVQAAQPKARADQIRKALTNEIVKASQARNG